MSDAEPFYVPTSETFGHDNAYDLFTNYAADLQRAGLARHFPSDPEVRYTAIELLAERCTVSDVAADARLIADAIVEAIEIRYARRSK